MPHQLINMSNNSSCSMTIPPSDIINDGICNNGLTQTISGNNLLESSSFLNVSLNNHLIQSLQISVTLQLILNHLVT